jgi:hypothetical protein
VLGRSELSSEVVASLGLAPGSYIVQRNLPSVRTYEAFQALPVERQRELRSALASLPVGQSSLAERVNNYEAHHPPLAYVLLAPVEWGTRTLPLVDRVLWLRLAASWAATLGTAAGVRWLIALCGGRASTALFVLFCLFSTQMFWATVAHISNDWLAVALGTALLAGTIRIAARPGFPAGLWLGLLLGAGLLTKAYFLAVVPVVLGTVMVCHWRAVGLVGLGAAGGIAWYARNWFLFGSPSGMVKAGGRWRSGIC